jgi:hypothetical protein
MLLAGDRPLDHLEAPCLELRHVVGRREPPQGARNALARGSVEVVAVHVAEEQGVESFHLERRHRPVGQHGVGQQSEAAESQLQRRAAQPAQARRHARRVSWG